MAANGTIELEFIRNFWLSDVRGPLDKGLVAAPSDKLDWSPEKNMLSLGNIFMHIAETSMWWIGKLIDNIDFEDLTPGVSPSKERIKTYLDGHWERVEGFFDRTPAIVEKTYSRYHNGKDYDFHGRWVMLHLLEHDIHHRCQVNQYLRILGIEPPKI
jgi:uncharacterized damage-inducible protein DinB